uniref:CitMHS domain-containing protein n=1 Tax=Mesocestoides corti TaxID=53468 RepID=A0A5K3EL26_MESCO
MQLPGWLKWIIKYKSLVFLVLYPIILCPILIAYPQQESKGAYTLLLMAGYWITEVIPIYVTGMLPLVMGPLMGLMSSGEACHEYMRDSIMLFIHGAFLAVATEHRNLHRRIGVAVMKVMGGDPRLLMLGLMLPTWFLSMWMSNAAATIMMLTIVEALMSRLEAIKPAVEEGIALRTDEENGTHDAQAWNTGDSNESVTVVAAKDHKGSGSEDLQKLGCGLSLGIAFASSCGGMGTVIGTPTNVVLFGLVTDTYGPETTLSFGTWAAYGIPLSLILLLFVWAILGMIFIGPKKFFACKNPDKSREAAIRQILDEEKRSLGPIEWAEGSAIGILAVIVVLWVTRKPGVDGWAALVPSGFNKDGKSIPLTTDTQAAVLGTILVCAWPANNPFRRRQPTEQDIDPLEPVLPWKVAQSRCPWQVLFLIGGGFCLSRMCTVSGLSDLVGEYLIGLKSLPLPILIYVFTVVSSVITTFVANAATATVLLPIMFQLVSRAIINDDHLSP